MIKTFLAKLIYTTHLLSIAFLLLGCYLPERYLLAHIVFIPLVILQWRLNSNQCVLTQLQHKLEGKTLNNEEEGQFIKALFAKFGLSPSAKQLMATIYGLLYISFAFSVYRYV